MDLTGSFSVEATGVSPDRRLLIAAADVTGFVGDRKGTVSAADDAGVQISGGTVLAVVNASGTYGLYASGTAELVGGSGVSLTGSLTALRNTTGAAVNE
ncbi:MAG: hypothetical protein ACKPJJ_09775, partial [Planctomycetaceae bacterium]